VGEAADQKVKEIEETRSTIERDVRELEARMPSPLRSGKRAIGIAVGSGAATGLLLALLRRRRRKRDDISRKADVTVRVGSDRSTWIGSDDGHPGGPR
jgi:hypothetical protein